jgi:NADH:ubiquinone oxidoreductase subunit K
VSIFYALFVGINAALAVSYARNGQRFMASIHLAMLACNLACVHLATETARLEGEVAGLNRLTQRLNGGAK